MGRYRALQDHLALATGLVTMSFEDVEQLVGPLPESAHHYRAWWANTRENRSQARAWLNAGYVVGQVDLTAETVEFLPDVPLPSDDVSEGSKLAGVEQGEDEPASSSGAISGPPDWQRVLRSLAARLGEHVDVGLEHLLTEDIVRWELVSALRGADVPADALRIEHQQPDISAQFDLVIGDPVTSVVELKYPRDPRNSGAADTMTTGEILRDFYRLAWVDVDDAWAVQVLQTRILAHLQRRREFSFLTQVGEAIVLEAGVHDALPRTAAALLPEWTRDVSLVATCEFSATVGTLSLVGFQVRRW